MLLWIQSGVFPKTNSPALPAETALPWRKHPPTMTKKSLPGLFALLLLAAVSGFAQQPADFIVAADGSGDFRTVQEAVNAVPPFRKKRTVIFVKAGVYKEKLVVPPTASDLTLIGEDVQRTIITFDDFAARKNRFGEEMGTTSSSSCFIFADGFEAFHLTFENSAGAVGQAVAVRIAGDRVRFENCRFLGHQDTLYPFGKSSRQYYKNCYIEGTVDFIFGWSSAVFDSCTLFCKAPGYITAASTEQGAGTGFIFRHCTITGNAPEGSVYLGRPWRPYAQVVFWECTMSAVVRPEGWHNWDKPDAEKTASFAEYGSTGPGGGMERRVAWSKHLSDSEAKIYSGKGLLGDWEY